MASTAAFKRHLIHTCTIQRATVSEDPYGDDLLTWSDLDQDVSCRLVSKREKILSDAVAQAVSVTSELMLFAHDVDIMDRDRITNLVLEDGSLVTGDNGLTPQTWIIESLLVRRRRTARHISVELKRVS